MVEKHPEVRFRFISAERAEMRWLGNTAAVQSGLRGVSRTRITEATRRREPTVTILESSFARISVEHRL